MTSGRVRPEAESQRAKPNMAAGFLVEGPTASARLVLAAQDTHQADFGFGLTRSMTAPSQCETG